MQPTHLSWEVPRRWRALQSAYLNEPRGRIHFRDQSCICIVPSAGGQANTLLY